jgi:hypothetical protein
MRLRRPKRRRRGHGPRPTQRCALMGLPDAAPTRRYLLRTAHRRRVPNITWSSQLARAYRHFGVRGSDLNGHCALGQG